VPVGGRGGESASEGLQWARIAGCPEAVAALTIEGQSSWATHTLPSPACQPTCESDRLELPPALQTLGATAGIE
jgi:hypothetical protein